MNKTYTDQDDAIIKEHWIAGTFIKEIAALVGRSEGSLKGRIRRLGLERRKLGKNMQTNKKSKEPYKRPAERLIAYGIPKPLLDLGTWECHFQIDGIKEFCAAPTNKPYGYCAEHRSICFRHTI